MDPTNISKSSAGGEFGKYSGTLGTIENTKVFSRVNRIVEYVEGAFIGLSGYQMHNLISSFGVFTVKNPETHALMDVEIYNACGEDCTTDSKEIIISKLVADTLKLKQGSPIEIVRTLDPVGAVKWACKQNKDNHFGQDWCHRSYGAVGTIVSSRKDSVEGRPEIYFTDMQKKYLRLEKHLYPLCGKAKFSELKKHAPKALGIVKIKYQDKLIEVDAYSNYQCDSYQGSAILISNSLLKQLSGEFPLGKNILINSRFDKTMEEALEDKSPPQIEMDDESSNSQNCFQHVFNSSLEDLQKEFSVNYVTDSFSKHAGFLNGLAKQADVVAAHPEIFRKITHIFCHHVYDSFEYSNFLNSLKAQHEVIKKNWKSYLDIIRAEWLSLTSDSINPQILQDIIKMGFVNRQNSKGETVIHIAFTMGKGSFELEAKKKKYALDFNIKNIDGQTPLHYAANNEEKGWGNIILYKKYLNPLIKDNSQRLPLHLACMNNNTIFIKLLFEEYPNDAETFLNAIDVNGKKPFDYLTEKDVINMLISTEAKDLENQGWNLAISEMVTRNRALFESIMQAKDNNIF